MKQSEGDGEMSALATVLGRFVLVDCGDICLGYRNKSTQHYTPTYGVNFRATTICRAEKLG